MQFRSVVSLLAYFVKFSMAADSEEYYGYYYNDDQDRGLLDAAWERQQKKVRSLNVKAIATVSDKANSW